MVITFSHTPTRQSDTPSLLILPACCTTLLDRTAEPHTKHTSCFSSQSSTSGGSACDTSHSPPAMTASISATVLQRGCVRAANTGVGGVGRQTQWNGFVSCRRFTLRTAAKCPLPPSPPCRHTTHRGTDVKLWWPVRVMSTLSSSRMPPNSIEPSTRSRTRNLDFTGSCDRVQHQAGDEG